MTELQNLIQEALNSIDSNTWLNTCNYVEKIEKEYMKYFDSNFEFVINIGESSDSGTDEFKSNGDSLNKDD